MDLKEAYKKAFTEEIEALVATGKITVLGALEKFVNDFIDSTFNALQKGAEYSGTKVDDTLMPTLLSTLQSIRVKKIDPLVDKIDGQENL